MKPRIRTGGKIFEWKIFQYLRYAIVFLIAQFFKLWFATLRVSVPEDFESVIKTQKPRVVIFWHNHLFIAPYWYKWSKSRNVYAMISAGTIGAWITPFFNCFGYKAVRGSVNLRNKQMLKEAVKVVQDGGDLVSTPDGSRGPMYKFKPGAALVARKTNCALFFLSCDFKNAWRLNTWDKFYVPKPFSKVEVSIKYYDSLKGLTKAEDLDTIQNALEEELLSITSDPLFPNNK